MLDALRHWFLAHGGWHRRAGQRHARHYGRRALQDHISAQRPLQASPDALSALLLQVARDDTGAALARLKAHADGLSLREAAARLAHHGPNAVDHDPAPPPWLHLWHCYKNPFNLLLSALAAVSWLTGDAKATVVIGVMVLLSTGVRFIQEGRSNRAAERLKAMVSNTATVLRHQTGAAGAEVEVPMHDLVPGDIVRLSAGDMIPADARVLQAQDLFVAQAAMTGEALPVEKVASARSGGSAPLEQDNLVFMGTNVVSGSARVLVVATGAHTYFGNIATRMGSSDSMPTAFQAGVNSVSWLLIRFAAVMVPIVLLINGYTQGDWLQAGLFTLSVAVGLTPEMLPMIVTTTLAKGAVMLSRRQVVVKRLDAIQNFGAMDVLCTDKTGTLTQDQVVLGRHVDAWGQPSQEVLTHAYLNSHFQTGLKNLLDRAVLAHAEVATEMRLAQDWHKIDEIPFDFERRRMSVVVARQDGQAALVCKGALEEVLACCTQVREAGGTDVPLDATRLAQVQQAAHALNEEGLRVVAVAIRPVAAAPRHYAVADEADLTLIGYIAFLDPPKDSAAPALKALADHGVRVLVLSGDNGLVSARVCRQVGLPVERVVLGPEIEAMDDVALAQAVQRYRVFAKLAPLHKERIVRMLRSQGHVVGFLGDGINDAPALRAADIGISVDSAVDIAKEAADIILLEKSLMVLDQGVVEGRSTFCNMLKYIRMTASSNFGNVLSVLVASAFLPFLPMLPLQLLVQNLLYDVSQTAIPFDSVDADLVGQPLQWNPADIGRFMLFFGPISSVFDIATFALMWHVFGAQTLAQQGLFQSGWFVEGLLTQTLIVHMIRSPRLPFVQSRAAWPLLLTTAAVAAIGLWLPLGPLAAAFRLQPLPLAYFAWLAALLLGYALLTSVMKGVYVRRYGWQ